MISNPTKKYIKSKKKGSKIHVVSMVMVLLVRQ